MPFANGPRQCIGSQLALQEMAQALGAVVRAFVIAPGPDPVRPDPVVTVRVKGGLRVQLQPRGGALGQAGAPPR
jgi:cytochrome P450